MPLRSVDLDAMVCHEEPRIVARDNTVTGLVPEARQFSSDTRSDVYVLSLQGEPKPRAIVATAAYEGGPQFSPDGKWLAYASDTSGQGFQVFVHPFPGPDRSWLAAPSGNYPR